MYELFWKKVKPTEKPFHNHGCTKEQITLQRANNSVDKSWCVGFFSRKSRVCAQWVTQFHMRSWKAVPHPCLSTGCSFQFWFIKMKRWVGLWFCHGIEVNGYLQALSWPFETCSISPAYLEKRAYLGLAEIELQVWALGSLRDVVCWLALWLQALLVSRSWWNCWIWIS